MSTQGPEFTQEDMLATDTGSMIDVCVEMNGPKPAFTCVLPSGHSHTLTYNEIGRQSDAVAFYLREVLKLSDRDVVAIQSPNILAYPVVAFGVFKAGLKLTNVNPMYTPEETRHQLSDSGAKVWFVVEVFGDKVAECVEGTGVEKIITLSMVDLFPGIKRTFLDFMMKKVKKIVPEISVPVHATLKDVLQQGAKISGNLSTYRQHLNEDTTAIYQYTGGTTGRSKGAELTHRNVVGNISQGRKRNEGILDENDSETMMLILPLYHVYALAVGALSSMYAGTHVVLVPVPRPLSVLKTVFEKFDITLLPGVNTLYLGLLQEDWFQQNPPKTLKYCFSGAAPLQPATFKAWHDLTGSQIYEGYGLTEGTCMITGMPLDEEPRMGTCGKVLPGTEIKVVDDDGNSLPSGEAGELLIRGPQVMKGYLNRPEVNKETLVDGWLKTGDVATIDEDGYLRIVDRIKDMVIVSGFNVYPTDIEDVLTRCDSVAEAAVVGVPDAKTGEKVVAYVVPAENDLTPDTVLSHCREHLTGYKMPRIVELVSELPKSPVGKVLRREIRDEAKEKFGS